MKGQDFVARLYGKRGRLVDRLRQHYGVIMGPGMAEFYYNVLCRMDGCFCGERGASEVGIRFHCSDDERRDLIDYLLGDFLQEYRLVADGLEELGDGHFVVDIRDEGVKAGAGLSVEIQIGEMENWMSCAWLNTCKPEYGFVVGTGYEVIDLWPGYMENKYGKDSYYQVLLLEDGEELLDSAVARQIGDSISRRIQFVDKKRILADERYCEVFKRWFAFTDNLMSMPPGISEEMEFEDVRRFLAYHNRCWVQRCYRFE